jgi:hypothetical protein
VLVPVAAFCAGAAFVVASHAAFTYKRYGHAHISAPTAALNFVEGKCPSKNNYDSEGHGWLSPLFVQLGETQDKHWPRPFDDSKYYFAAGIDCVKHDPWVLVKSVRYVYYLFFDNQMWPPNTSDSDGISRSYSMAYSAFFFPNILLGATLLARRLRRRTALLLTMGLSIVLCSWVFKSELRYRVPFDVVFIPMAVLSASWTIERLVARRPRGT